MCTCADAAAPGCDNAGGGAGVDPAGGGCERRPARPSRPHHHPSRRPARQRRLPASDAPTCVPEARRPRRQELQRYVEDVAASLRTDVRNCKIMFLGNSKVFDPVC